ncbi:His/Gly/Thr/Pro-type tRNA ligase C-terminal domain-containing protein [Okeania sp. SIO2C9]|uniref:His/Gly/Thr/Pro-type tRNA ligase C-terminal domain-containing protein n=1 Tax=Okeania sp. SIO2C9 TaxID=2607791 RepID=UPI00345DB680
MEVAENLYQELNETGIETILDDRDEGAGFKFKDADLICLGFAYAQIWQSRIGRKSDSSRSGNSCGGAVIYY